MRAEARAHMMNGRPVWTVRDLTRYVKQRLENDELLQNVWVSGEISNFTHHTSGHMYFTLKDKDSRIRCVMFAQFNRHLPFMPREGAKVIARGQVSVYERDGQYQFYVVQMQPDGIGSLYVAFEQLKRKLEEEGLFDAARKKPIPRFPRAVGVITSPTGAAIQDILTTLRRRFPHVPVLLCPVHVQGKLAAPSIVRAISLMQQHGGVDVLIVGRGGGSLEELWAFNEEIVARAIAACRIPVISAVGHETDFTIADFVADLRAPTPTAAAELAVPHHLELRQHVWQLGQRLEQALRWHVASRRERLERLRRSPYLAHPERQLMQPAERLDRLRERLGAALESRVGRQREALLKLERNLHAHHPRQQVILAARRHDSASRALVQAARNTLDRKRMLFASAVRQLDALSPLKVMQRGYSLVYDERMETVIKSISQVQPGDLVRVRLKDGQLDCQVWSMKGE
jgi:exodeoxyribonuclease VII large subunit